VRRGNERRCLLSDSRRMIFGPSEQRTPLHRRGSSRCRRETSIEQLRTEGRRSRRSRRGCAIPSRCCFAPARDFKTGTHWGRRTGQAATSAAGESPGKAQLGPFRRSHVILDAQPAGQPIGLRGWRWGSGLGARIRWVGAAQASGGEAVVAQGMGGSGNGLGKDEVKGNRGDRVGSRV
jgi:hypothetical protein